MEEHQTDVDRSVYAVNFPEVPELGTRIRFGRNKRGSAILIEATPYQRKDGEQSFVLTWKRNNGGTGTSGLRSKNINWRSK